MYAKIPAAEFFVDEHGYVPCLPGLSNSRTKRRSISLGMAADMVADMVVDKAAVTSGSHWEATAISAPLSVVRAELMVALELDFE